MCLAIPGKVVSAKDGKFIIDYTTEKREVSESVVDVGVGDWVIVSNKIIINKLTKEQAEDFFKMIRNMEDREAEEYFTRYAIPCLFVRVLRGEITKERHDEVNRNYDRGKTFSRSELEELFPAAFRRIKNLSREMKKDYWDIDVIRTYWREAHNKVIDEKEGNYAYTPEEFNDLCRVHEANVLSREGDLFIVSYNGKRRKVSGKMIPELKVGDKARIHFGYAIEKV